jgi:hypothetical protein
MDLKRGIDQAWKPSLVSLSSGQDRDLNTEIAQIAYQPMACRDRRHHRRSSAKGRQHRGNNDRGGHVTARPSSTLGRDSVDRSYISPHLSQPQQGVWWMEDACILISEEEA